MSALVSVIIPTYNRSKFVTEAIDSVLSQTYRNIELVVVNDGSTDDTEEKLQPYMDKIVYIKKENGGLSSALNVGLEASTGQYISRLDDDDLFMPDKTRTQLQVFAENPEIGLATCGYFITDETGRPMSVKKVSGFSRYGPFLSLLAMEWGMFPSTVMVRREVHDQIGGYKDIFCEDLEMFLRVTRHWGVGAIDQPLVKYKWNSDGITSTTPDEKKDKDIADFTRSILDDIQMEELFPEIDFASSPYRMSCAHAAKGSLYLFRKIFDRADNEFLRAYELCPSNSILKLWMGISARTQQNFALAEQHFHGIEETDALYPVAQNARILIRTIQKTPDEMLEALRLELSRERRKLFRLTFDAISGKVSEKRPVRKFSDALRASKYTVIIDNYPENGRHLLYNTFTRAMANVGDELRDFMSSSDMTIGQEALRDAEALKKMGILVSRGTDETELVRKWYKTFTDDLSSIELDLTILTTYDCNFACKYCIESGVKKPVYMDNECSDALVKWLIKRAEENDTKRLSLVFYGGEPLLNAEPILRISQQLHEYAIESGILLLSSIITNGSLIDGKFFQELARLGLTDVKVTLDGPEEIHNARRPFKDGRQSFNVILENIRQIPESIKLTVQSNLDEENIGSFPLLLDFLEESGLKDRIDRLNASHVAQSLGATTLSESRGMACARISDLRIAKEIVRMRKLVVERGFKSSYTKIRHVICGMARKGADVIVDPVGTLYDCPALVGRAGFAIGNIYHPELNPNLDEGISEAQLEQCINCSYFPVCGGGCRYISYTVHSDFTETYCERRLIEHQTRELVKLIYDQKTRQNLVSV